MTPECAIWTQQKLPFQGEPGHRICVCIDCHVVIGPKSLLVFLRGSPEGFKGRRHAHLARAVFPPPVNRYLSLVPTIIPTFTWLSPGSGTPGQSLTTPSIRNISLAGAGMTHMAFMMYIITAESLGNSERRGTMWELCQRNQERRRNPILHNRGGVPKRTKSTAPAKSP